MSEHPLDAAESAYETVDLPAFAANLRTACHALPTANLSRSDRVALAKIANVQLLEHLPNLDVLIALTSFDDEEAMTALHDHFAVGLTGR